MNAGATFSPCGAFRLHLWRQWSDDAPLVIFGLNPSTATAHVDDPTIRRCIGFGRTLGFGRLDMVNLFAFRATDPRDLRRAGYQIGDGNDDAIRETVARAVRDGGEVCCAWGARGTGLARVADVLDIVRSVGARPMCFAVTKGGQPQHPLFVPSDRRLREYAA